MIAPRPNLTAERRAQGLDAGVTDPATLQRVAVLVARTTRKKAA